MNPAGLPVDWLKPTEVTIAMLRVKKKKVQVRTSPKGVDEAEPDQRVQARKSGK